MAAGPLSPVWDPEWRRQRRVVLRETAGLDRADEPVELQLDFADDAVHDLARELRVVAVGGDGAAPREIPSQVYNLSAYHRGVRGTVVFNASVPAGGEAEYLICHDNPGAPAPGYRSDLTVTSPDEGLHYVIDTDCFHAELDPASGQLKVLTPRQIGGPPLETRERPVNVTPDIVAKDNLAYVNVKRWNPPDRVRVDQGSQVFAIHRSGTMDFPGPRGEPGLPTVEVGVTYRFFAGQPYFLQSSTIRFLSDMEIYSMRNGAEMAWKDNPFTHAVWQQPDGTVMNVAMDSLDPLTAEDRDQGARAEVGVDAAWFGFANYDTGAAVVALFLDYQNISPFSTDERAPTHNELIYVFAGPGDNYWFRAPIWEHCLQDPERCPATFVPAGSLYAERNAVYALRCGEADGFGAAAEMSRRLRNPLRASYRESDARDRRWQPAPPPAARPTAQPPAQPAARPTAQPPAQLADRPAGR
ncbi:MAG TPA: hypothetical protein VH637_09665 [Streptosporangiaceae bacterium]